LLIDISATPTVVSQLRDAAGARSRQRRHDRRLHLAPSRLGKSIVVRWSNAIAQTGWVTNGVMMAEDVRAEIVASVLEVVVNEGDQIGEGDTLVLLESMKMEIPVLAEVAGTVSKVSVSVGDVIQAGDLIAVIS
jgi:acetyl-CoA carboxylase biotin carboxyl carrier protein